MLSGQALVLGLALQWVLVASQSTGAQGQTPCVVAAKSVALVNLAEPRSQDAPEPFTRECALCFQVKGLLLRARPFTTYSEQANDLFACTDMAPAVSRSSAQSVSLPLPSASPGPRPKLAGQHCYRARLMLGNSRSATMPHSEVA